MKQAVFLALACACVATTGSTDGAAIPARPPDGTYTYAISGVPGLTQSVVVVVTHGSHVSTIEHATISGTSVAAVADYDAVTLAPLHYRIAQGGATYELTLGNGAATLLQPPTTRKQLPGTTALLLTEGLAAFRLMLPSATRANGLPMSVVALSGGFRVLRIDAAAATDSPPAGVPVTDVEVALADSDGARLTSWWNPQTSVVDRAASGPVAYTLLSRTDSTVTSTPAPAAIATPYPMASPLYSSREVSFASSGGAVLSGTLSVPNARRDLLPAFIFVHGSGAGTRDGAIPVNPTFAALGNALSNGGAIVLRYDKRGIGTSSGTATENWHPLVDDIRAAAAFLRTQPGVDPQRIFLLGHSEGGLLVPLAAPSIPGVAGVVLMAPPAVSIHRILEEQAPRMSPSMRPALARAFASYDDAVPAEVIRRVEVPILVLQGSRDMQVLPSDLHVLTDAAAAAHKRITVQLLSGDDHLFLRIPDTHPDDMSEYFIPAPLDPRVAQDILAWMQSLSQPVK